MTMDESIKYKLHLIEDAAGKYAVSAKNPTGLVAYGMLRIFWT